MTYHVLFTHSSVSGHLGGFYFGDIRNDCGRVGTSLCVDMCFHLSWVYTQEWNCWCLFFYKERFFPLSFATSVGFRVGAKVTMNAQSMVGGLNWRAYCRTTLYERTPCWSSDSGAQESSSRSFRLVCILDFTSSLEGGLDFLKLGNFLITWKYFEFFFVQVYPQLLW